METKKTKWIPEGYHSLNPIITVNDVEKALEFYKEAFGAEELSRLPGPGGSGIMHAELKIGDSIFMLGQTMESCSHAQHHEGHGGCMLYMYVENVDAAFEQAKAAGAQVKMPVDDMFWGDRCGTLTDPFGHEWSLGTHIEDLTQEQIRERAEAFFAKMAQH